VEREGSVGVEGGCVNIVLWRRAAGVRGGVVLAGGKPNSRLSVLSSSVSAVEKYSGVDGSEEGDCVASSEAFVTVNRESCLDFLAEAFSAFWALEAARLLIKESVKSFPFLFAVLLAGLERTSISKNLTSSGLSCLLAVFKTETNCVRQRDVVGHVQRQIDPGKLVQVIPFDDALNRHRQNVPHALEPN
jgi:hypothetical protein